MKVAHGINLAQLRAFVSVVDEGGFGSAAAALGVTQSAVSHAVAALERTAGGRVVQRTPRGNAPTAFGARLLDHARAALAATDAIGDLAAAKHGTPSGVVRLGAPPTVCQGLLPDQIPLWRSELPRISVRVFEGEDDEVEDWLGARAVEAAVLVDPPSSTPGALLATDTFQALLPREHALAGEARIEVADLAEDPMLFSGGSCERPILDLYRRAGIRLAPTHRVRELSTLFAMVRSGLGVTIVPSLVSPMLDGSLVLVALRDSHERRLVLTGPREHAWHPAVTALIDRVTLRRF
jgi:DNA-binding transcriptional LysR family regulator